MPENKTMLERTAATSEPNDFTGEKRALKNFPPLFFDITSPQKCWIIVLTIEKNLIQVKGIKALGIPEKDVRRQTNPIGCTIRNPGNMRRSMSVSS